MSNNYTSSYFAIGFITGIVIGSAIGVLYTPNSGRELRLKIADKVDNISARIDKFSHPEKYSRIKP